MGRTLAEYRFVRDPAETRFLDWRAVPEEIAVLPELTLGGVQMTGVGIERTAAEESQSAQDGETKVVNDSLWRNAA